MITNATAAPRRLIPLGEVREKVGLSKTTIYGRIAAGDFPRPVQLGSSSRWVESEVDAWIEQQIAQRDAPDKAA